MGLNGKNISCPVLKDIQYPLDDLVAYHRPFDDLLWSSTLSWRSLNSIRKSIAVHERGDDEKIGMGK